MFRRSAPAARLLLLLLIVTTPARGIAADPALSDRVAILPADAGPDLLHQCSRSTVSDPDSFFVPTRSEVAAIEAALPSFLARPGVRAPKAPLSEFYRQYVGVVAKGKRLVYAAFFHESARSDLYDWRTKAVNVCDGGDSFWGIVFDVDAGRFEPPDFNGEA